MKAMTERMGPRIQRYEIGMTEGMGLRIQGYEIAMTRNEVEDTKPE